MTLGQKYFRYVKAINKFKRQSVKVSIENGAQLVVFLPVSLSKHETDNIILVENTNIEWDDMLYHL